MTRKNYFVLLGLAMSCAMSGQSLSNDFNDGIGIDEPITDNIDVDRNVNFIVADAVAKAKKESTNGKIIINSGTGLGNINIGAGTDLSGTTIINLSDNENGTVIAE
jgi:hypothetical protein